MKATYHLLLPLLLATVLSTSIHAEDLTNDSVQGTGSGSDRLATYLLNLGAYLGYNITNPPPSSSSAPPPGSTLLDMLAIQNPEQAVFETVLGTIPVDAISAAFSYFVPKGDSTASINNQANAVFKTPPYNTATQDGNVTVSKLIDQPPYQNDPVSQSILNILGTPDNSFCISNDLQQWTGGSTGDTPPNAYPACTYLYGSAITNNVVGTVIPSGLNTVIPSTATFFSPDYNKQFLSQLNSNVLIAPLLYSTTADDQSSTGDKSSTIQNGLPAQSQAQQAANFIRYASGIVVPLALPSRSAYDNLFAKANTGANDPAQAMAQATLSAYLVSLRVYAAQSSVGFSNLYYMLSKRLPQPLTTTGGKDSPQPSSQALSEFKMATWRILNADQSTTNTPWLTQLNQASSATVEKEIATLLAEINYQLYLTRQQEERMLLTNTMLLLLSTHSTQPNTNALSAQNNNSLLTN